MAVSTVKLSAAFRDKRALRLLRIFQPVSNPNASIRGMLIPRAISRASCDELCEAVVLGSEEGRSVGFVMRLDSVNVDAMLVAMFEAKVGVAVAVVVAVEIRVGMGAAVIVAGTDDGHDGPPDMLNAADSRKTSPSSAV